MLKGYKTYILAAVAVIGAVAGWLVGDMTLVQAMTIAVPAVQGAFIRQGVTNTVTKILGK